MEHCGLQIRLSGLGVSEGEVDTLVENVRWDRLGVMPRPIDRDEMRGLLQGLM